MPRTRDLLLPPILQVLEEGHFQRVYTEGISSVITWINFDQLDRTKYKIQSKRPQTPLSYLMTLKTINTQKTIDLRDAEPAQEGIEHFSYIVAPNQDNYDSRTVFDEARSFTSRGFRSERERHGGFQGKITSLARKFIPSRKSNAFPHGWDQQYSS
ncbi:hypothetical protein CVT25_013580 [Psilocybe cyanescens]|uniref:Uncharacterized protein n=1 Tax=Psilocybe cyanescens TaxID=93625 RepID=A0A409XT38_PSICY|nr:hypothetical protein CVT25_013580 [Psilocybe cyanescens]